MRLRQIHQGPYPQDAWAEAIPEFFEQARADLNHRVKEQLVECLAPNEQRLAELVETLRRDWLGSAANRSISMKTQEG